MYYVGERAIYFNDNSSYKYVAEQLSDIQIPETCKKFYAVKIGKVKCICFNWEECRLVIEGVSGNQYKSFRNLEEAIEYIGIEVIEKVLEANIEEEITIHPECFAYVDGSYNDVKKLYGYGIVLINKDKKYEFSGSDNEKDMLSMRNVSGEILGSMRAIKEAEKLGIKEITIYYDYKGIECWATGEWKRNKKGTIAYYEFIQSMKDKIKINFVKVKAHSGVELNEIVDKLAKDAVGIN